MLREPSVRVREAAAQQLEERQSDWAYSKPVIALDMLWNAAFVGIAIAVLALSAAEDPSVPLRVWIIGYAFQCAVHMACVVAEYRRRLHEARLAEMEASRGWESGGDLNSNSGSGSDAEDYAAEDDSDDSLDGNSLAKNLESANTMFSFIWWIVGFYWVTAGGDNLVTDAPQLYWLSVLFLAFDVVFVMICVAVACLIGIAICCCLPCIIAILYVVTDQVPRHASKGGMALGQDLAGQYDQHCRHMACCVCEAVRVGVRVCMMVGCVAQ
ncbi:hypothetical protein L484_008863 [Morus notabilis]|uniref:RING-type E3 ubiquitin transferase n=1 Tax=Morus notabilis TaxID=981085 RepID=W9RNU2_9ROSA|nr:hypothetical protein L484_008863 [Morus notabilis]